MVCRGSALLRRRPVVALPWGSRSIRTVRRSASASPAERFTAVVVFPTPPFWLTTAITLAIARIFHVKHPTEAPAASFHVEHYLTQDPGSSFVRGHQKRPFHLKFRLGDADPSHPGRCPGQGSGG